MMRKRLLLVIAVSILLTACGNSASDPQRATITAQAAQMGNLQATVNALAARPPSQSQPTQAVSAAATSSATQAPVATAIAPIPTPAPTATPFPTATPAPKSGNTLYQADWSNGLNGWPSIYGWKTLDGVLINDGTNVERADWKTTWVTAPYQVQIRDYAVEAEVQMLKVPSCGSFGLAVREAYQAGLHICPGNYGQNVSIRPKDGGELKVVPVSPNTNWHIYRFEVQGNSLKFFIDGALIAQVADNRYLSPGEAGLFDDSAQLNVRSFRIVAL